ncbi:MAG TPA: TAT-variant-translocated molybdopterin oxidoreductase [Phycisphaerales bacterium]|nr:TAT-variant-translocated molybdopterin oxidoreductase [Phycisphaerales bacterium]HMP36015.1 TAT-variant-translocated molybdopterin oxidoreductase [Phycisphaerales bacterium]
MSPLNSTATREQSTAMPRDVLAEDGRPAHAAIERSDADSGSACCASGSASAGLRKSLSFETAADASPSAPRGERYWRSFEELAETPEFNELVDREFSAASSELVTPEERRHFMKVMGASFALAGVALTGCRRLPEVKIAPYASRPENRTPGVPVRYATSMEVGGVARPLLATSYDSRPIKLDGNNLHPSSLGGSDVFMQAAILDLYDVDRSREVFAGGEASSWSAFEAFAAPHFASLAAARGAGLAIVAEASSSPTLASLRDALRSRLPEATWATYEPVNDDQERAGTAIVFGSPRRVRAVFHDGLGTEGHGAGGPTAGDVKATVILSLDCDFLGDHPSAVRLSREFAAVRRVAGSPASSKSAARSGDGASRLASMVRLYMVDGGCTVTGVMADERMPVRVVDVPAVGAAIALRILEKLGSPASPSLVAALRALAESDSGRAAIASCDAAVLDAAARDLLAARGSGAILVGGSQPAALHAAACVLNQQLGNVGRTISFIPVPDLDRPSSIDALKGVVEGLDAGRISTVVMLGTNPVYTAPADLDFAAALSRARTSIHCGLMRDETARRCSWHLPRPHPLECWSDALSEDGTYTIQQPLIAPMIDPGQGGLSPLELLAQIILWCGIAGLEPAAARIGGGESLLRATVSARIRGTDVERTWRRILHDGFLAGSPTGAARNPTIDVDATAARLAALASGYGAIRPDGIEVAFRTDPKVYDGRYSNNAWLQELPDPLTKLTWDNAAVMSLATANRLGVRLDDVVSISVDGRSVEAAVYVLPGHPDSSITLTLGYGRGSDAGHVAESAGFNAYAIRPSASPAAAIASNVSKTARRYHLVSTQDRGAGNPVAEAGIQDRLPTLVRETTLENFRHHPDFAKHPTKDFHVAHRLSLWEETNLEGATHRWAMSVDLSTCTGCNACVIACQAENNIPVVGKEQVRRGREMQWMRIDRYFRGGDPARPHRTVYQPVTCLHCEMAPCEQVCPVAATVHDEDGLNVMVYNRCVGTRYCSNNCPYKVRRFNYFDWNRMIPSRENNWIQHDMGYYFRDGPDEWRRMQFNPEVTVRMRGVMEKCTFCTQRITQAKIDAKNAWARAGGSATAPGGYRIPDGAIVTACEAACPAQAIVFGDLNDPKSRVAALHKDLLAYEMLEELNTKPRLKYLARLNNPAVEPASEGHAEAAGAHS